MTPRISAKLSAVALTCAMAWSSPVHATHSHAPAAATADAPPAAAPTAEAPSAEAPTAAPAADPADLAAARDEAVAAALADPSPANHRRVAELAESAGDFAGAATAYQSELDALGPEATDARAAANADLQRVRERARGTVADEGASSHRKELDRAWAPAPPVEAKPAQRPVAPVKPSPDDRIVKKWYFWVTLGAIAASAVAVTVIAIKASRNDKPDALDRSGRLPPLGQRRFGVSGLRF